MIANSHEFYVTLRHFTSMTDMLTALYLDAKERNDFALFPVISEGYFINLRQLSAELQEYLQAHPEAGERIPSEVAQQKQGEAA